MKMGSVDEATDIVCIDKGSTGASTDFDKRALGDVLEHCSKFNSDMS